MSFLQLLGRNLLYHLRSNIAVLLGVAVGTAVLTGALLVGDSLRGSLRTVTLRQLGWVEQALLNPRFFRQELATTIDAKRVAPVIFFTANVAKTDANGEPIGPQVREVTLLGVNQTFWDESEIPGEEAYWNPPENQPIDLAKRSIVINAELANSLQVKAGDYVTYIVEKVTSTPRESVLGRRKAEDVLTTLTLPVKEVLPANHFGGHFTLNPRPTTPKNAFLPLRVLQEEIRAQQGRNRTLPYAPINAILVAGGDSTTLAENLQKNMTLADWGLELKKHKRRFGIPAPKYRSLESNELFVPESVQNAVAETGLTHADTMVYLVNNMATKQRYLSAACFALAPPGMELSRMALANYTPVEVPYFVVAGLQPELPPPLGPFLPKGAESIPDNGIVLVDWPKSPLEETPSTTPVVLSYFEPDAAGDLEEVQQEFQVAGHLPLAGPTNDLFLTPQFPGITDRVTLDSWDPPFPFDKFYIHDRDDEFWRDHRTTPKAYVSLATAQKLWGSRYGDVTSIRIDPNWDGKELSNEEIEKKILSHLQPREGGLFFQNIREETLKASSGGMDFGGLFLGFSFFIIIAALLLVGLLFRLNMDQRAKEIGILQALGLRQNIVLRLLLVEGVVLTLIGSAVGCLLAVGYSQWMLWYLRTNWPGGLEQTFLQYHYHWLTFVYGYLGAIIVSSLTIWFSLRAMTKVPAKDLIQGVTTAQSNLPVLRKFHISYIVLYCAIAVSILCFVSGFFLKDHQMQAGIFLFSGMALLTAGLTYAWIWIRGDQRKTVGQRGLLGLALLGMRNAGRHPVRSLLTMGLLAFASFLVVAVQAFQRSPTEDFLQKDGGSGGFPLLAESAVPIYQDLNNPDNFRKTDKESRLLEQVKFFPFRVKDGDDASCLNLYQPRQPRFYGVPEGIIERGGFHFSATLAKNEITKENPWLLLNDKLEDDAIPVFGETNTVVWMLKKGLGGDLKITDANGKERTLRLVGLLQDSVFQGELLMSSQHFEELFPNTSGFRFFLLEPKNDSDDLQAALEKQLGQYGFVVTSTTKRLQSFLAVENTYLGTFQALGGLGLLLGVLGLAVVLVRSVLERRKELALLRAFGYRQSNLGWLILTENAYLLLLGLLIGLASAWISVTPYALAGEQVLSWQMASLLLLVLVVGLVSELIAVACVIRTPLIPALRQD